MPDDFHNIFEVLKKESLSPQERLSIRSHLSRLIDAHPARVPFLIRARDYIESKAPQLQPHMRSGAVRAVAFACLIVVVAGISTSYAAERALPGNLLYAVKTNVNEPVLGALALSQSAKAQWNARLATRRLDEAQTLAMQGKLTPVAATGLAASLEEATQRFDADALSEKPTDAGELASARADLENSLDAHADELARLEQSSTSAQPILTPFIVRIRAQALALQFPANGAPGSGGEVAIAADARGNVPHVKAAPMRAAAAGQDTPQAPVPGDSTVDEVAVASPPVFRSMSIRVPVPPMPQMLSLSFRGNAEDAMQPISTSSATSTISATSTASTSAAY